MNSENTRIKELTENIRKRVANKNQHKKEHMRQEQGNLMFDENTPETTVKKARNSKPRGSKPKEQNLGNENQKTLGENENVQEGITRTLNELRTKNRQADKETKEKKEQESNENKKSRVKAISEKAERLSERAKRNKP